MKENELTDINFELFNYCNGSCSGCMLNAIERKNVDLASPLDTIFKGLQSIKDYGKKTGLLYRPVFSFGDVPKLDIEEQFAIYHKTIELGLNFGLTLTCVDPLFNYKNVIDKIISLDNDLVLDITIDPIRLLNLNFRTKYLENLQYATSKAGHLHLQVLLSNHVMKMLTPQKLSELLYKIGDYPVFLGFSPTIENLTTKDRHDYELLSAFQYAKEFYQTRDSHKALLRDEISRFKNEGQYKDFSQQTFHIDSFLNVYPLSYSIYGDIIQDKRNNMKPFGNLQNSSLFDILHNNKEIEKINIINNLEISNSPFECENCEFFNACTFQGIGLIRKTYKGFEQRAGSCYGPINLI